MGGDTDLDLYELSLELEGRFGVPPLICVNGKAALHRRWQLEGFTKQDMVRNRLRKHRGNVGTVMGNGLVGIDVDWYKAEGAETYQALADLDWLPATASQRTQSGGLHLLYRYDPDVGDIGCGDFAKIAQPDGTPFPGGAEWKGQGGYLVCYGWDDSPVAPIHPELAAVLIGGRRRARADAPDVMHPKTLEACSILEEHYGGHHRVVADADDGRRYLKLTRPGKDAAKGTSCSIGEIGDGVVKIWSKGWPPFAYEQVIDLSLLHATIGTGPKIHILEAKPAPDELKALIPITLVRSERLTWLWKDRIPARQTVLVAGYEELGKSSAMVWVGARLTRGELPGDFEGEAMDVCYVSAEDGAEHILKPRAEAAGADPRRFYVLNPRPQADGYSLAVIRDVHPGLVIFDPWSVFLHLGAGSSENSEMAIRQGLQPFAELASEGVTVCGIRHFRKGGAGDNPHDVVLGSKAWTAACRSTLFFVPDPEHRDEPRGLIFTRGNLTRPVPGCCYQLNSTDVPLDDGTIGNVPVFGLGGPTSITLDEALGPRQTPSARSEAEDFLNETLRSGRVELDEIMTRANERAISWATLRRAKKNLGVVYDYEGAGKDRVTYWRLPHDKEDAQDAQDARISE